jgi:hypothetical protein
MTTTDTTATLTPEARALLGCPQWCTVDHLDGPMTAPGEHVRDLARVGKDHSVDLGATAWCPTPIVNISLGGNLSVELPATRASVEELRDIAGMLRQAADELSGLLQSGELEVQS